MLILHGSCAVGLVSNSDWLLCRVGILCDCLRAIYGQVSSWLNINKAVIAEYEMNTFV